MAQLTVNDTRPKNVKRPRNLAWPVGREITLILLGLLGYRMVRWAVRDETVEAFSNARRVVDWERAVGIFNEVDLQSLVLGLEPVIWFINRYYFFGHFVGMAVLLVWMFVRHFDRYGRVRRVLFMTTGVGLGLHVVFPLAPPRWFDEEYGFVDTLQTYGPKVYDSATVTSTANQIAAMPSLHVGWALIVAWAVVNATNSRWRWLAVGHFVITVLGVVLTANHWWLDAVAAVGLVWLAILADRPVQHWLEMRAVRRAEQEEAAAEAELVAAG